MKTIFNCIFLIIAFFVLTYILFMAIVNKYYITEWTDIQQKGFYTIWIGLSAIYCIYIIITDIKDFIKK